MRARPGPVAIMATGAATAVASALPTPIGSLSRAICQGLSGGAAGLDLSDLSPVWRASPDPLFDDDLQLSLYVLYELHYRGFAGVDDAWEWHPQLLRLRGLLEGQFLDGLYRRVGPPAAGDGQDIDLQLRAILDADSGPSLSRFLESRASLAQFQEFVVHRSAYQLKEADPHSWAIPRLDGRPKAALLEVQFDEYGEADPERMHSHLFAQTMSALSLDSRYGAYLDVLPAITLATVNLMSLFGLHRRWRGAIVGHLAAFEMSSSLPNRRYSNGLLRLGTEARARRFYDVHVLADAVHENIAAVDLAGGLVDQDPSLAGDVLFGARCLVSLDAAFAEHLLGCWHDGRGSLRQPVLAGEQ